MKFGDTLQQRSVPRWKRQNIDYSTVKKLIKEITTPGHGKAISIPGQGDSVAESFEDTLYTVLIKEHDRVGLFVKSKVYEVSSRLDSIARQLEIIKGPRSQDQLRRNTVSIRRKLSKVESEILSVGEEIQDLSRFVAINRLAIHKLLKKYRKWTGSTTLNFRMSEMLKKPSSFTKTRLTQSVNRYTTYLDEIRSPYGKQSTILSPSPTKTSPDSPLPFNTFDNLEAAFNGSGVEFDSALSIAPRRKSSRIAKYWVHHDNVVELRILLLQHLRYASVAPEDMAASPSKYQTQLERIEKADEIGSVVLDSKSHFTEARYTMVRSASASKSLETHGTVVARWSSNGDMAAVLPGHRPKVVKLHKSQLGRIIPTLRPLSGESDDFSTVSDDQGRLRDFFTTVEDLEALAFSCSSRSRFVGLENEVSNAAWAALDEDVQIGKCKMGDIRSPEDLRGYVDKRVTFPHAVLTVRTEGEGSYLLSVLDKSHLTERVDDFCLAVHAVAACCRPAGMGEVSWMPLLNKDIRHIPKHERRSSEQSSRLNSAGSGTTKYPSQTDTTPSEPSANNQVSTPQNTTRENRRERRVPQRLRPITTTTPLQNDQPQQQRYWNEYDNPESEAGGDAFYVYIDPNAPVFPGQHTLTKIGRKFINLLNLRDTSNRSNDLEHQHDAHSRIVVDENTRLLLPPNELATPKDLPGIDSSLSDESSSSSDDDNNNHAHQTYRTNTRARLPLFASLRFSSSNKRRPASYPPATDFRGSTSTNLPIPFSLSTRTIPETVTTQQQSQRLRLCLIALSSSLIILIIAAGLESVAKHKYRERVDIFAIIGAAASISFSLLGLAQIFTWNLPSSSSSSTSARLSTRDELRQGLGLTLLHTNNTLNNESGWFSMPHTVVGSWTAASVGVAAIVLVAVDIWVLVRTIA